MTESTLLKGGDGIAPRSGLAFLAMRRTLDLCVSIGSLLVLSPAFALVAIAIKLTSPGPVLFSNTVIGKNGIPFTYYKFRSMRTDMDDSKHRAFIENYIGEGKGHVDEETGEEVFKLTDDPRITGIGKIIRRISIDEFPQMLNVVKGDMSVVGPRPPVQYEYDLYDEHMKQRLLVKPGLTGLNQIRARSQSSFEQMYADDMEYIENQSIGLDLKIMVLTPWVMLFGKGAT